MWIEIAEAPQNMEVLTCFMVNLVPMHRKYRILLDGVWYDENGQCEKPTHIWSD